MNSVLKQTMWKCFVTQLVSQPLTLKCEIIVKMPVLQVHIEDTKLQTLWSFKADVAIS